MTDELKKTTPATPFNPRATLPASTRYPEKPTVETQTIPALLGEIQESVRTGFERVNANIDTLSHSFDGLQDRVARLEEREAKSRTGPSLAFGGGTRTQSGEVRRISENDMSQDAAIAKVITAQAATDAKVDALITSQAKQTSMQVEIKSAVTGWVKQHPEITSGLSTLLGVIIALLTAWFQSKVHQ